MLTRCLVASDCTRLMPTSSVSCDRNLFAGSSGLSTGPTSDRSNLFAFIAIHNSRRAAIDAGAEEKIIEAVKEKLYVDDYLISSSSVEEDLEEATIVERVLAATNLHLQRWVSNSHEFTQSFAKKKPAVVNSPGCHMMTLILPSLSSSSLLSFLLYLLLAIVFFRYFLSLFFNFFSFLKSSLN